MRCIVRLSHRQGDLSLLVHVAAGMTFSCLKLPVSHSLNATALAVASLNPKGDSLRTQKAAALLSHRQRGPQTCMLLSETSPQPCVAASDPVSVAGAFAGAVRAQGRQAYCCSFHGLLIPNYPLQPSVITLELMD